MQKNNDSNFYFLGKLTFILVFLLLFSSTNLSTGVNASVREDALSTVINFLKAQKSCNVDDMLKYSEYTTKMSNQRDFYISLCKDQPLKQAKITDLTIINDSVVLVSIESTYKDRIYISTSPVIKKDGHWKIVKGITGPGYVDLSNKSNRNSQEVMVKKAIESYSNAVYTGDLTGMKKYIKILPHTNKETIENHLKAIIEEQPRPEVTPFGVKIISDTFAIAQIETKYKYFSFTQNYCDC
ncbi:hypothetical protein ACFSO7_08975 [Bacillus sp. CGMCC 1.16607]|uniref:hypothetical protein n=1 Tax=Bacillus sp. CGMCC 1.16607 TaxID=3351842 RepID=UPI00363EE968